MNKEFEEKLRQIVAQWTTVPIKTIEPLDPDASARLYTRIHFKDTIAPKKNTALAMFFENTRGPEVGSGEKIAADDAYFELTNFFSSNSVAVPELYFDARQQQTLLIEDCGSVHLADALVKSSTEKREALLESALDILVDIQSIKSSDSLVFKREFSAEVFKQEMMEFPLYFLSKYLDKQVAMSRSEEFFDWLSAYIFRCPQTVVHRDFHAWNILVDDSGALRTIDFQDSLLGPRCYDIASLLHDRDSDSLIGKDLVRRISDSFLKRVGASRKEMLAVLLQRDLKVAGRFVKLSEAGKGRYQQWVGGTVSRIFRVLSELATENDFSQHCAPYLSYLEDNKHEWSDDL